MQKREIRFFSESFVTTFILLLDIIFLVAADLFSFIIRFNGKFPDVNFSAYLDLAPFIIAFRLISFYVFHLYSRLQYKSNFEILINIIKACIISSAFIIFILYFMNLEMYPRSIAAFSLVLTIIFISSWRFVAKSVSELYLGKHFFKSHLVIIGTGPQAQEVALRASRDASVNHAVLGFVQVQKENVLKSGEASILGSIDNIAAILREYRPDEVVIAESSIDRRNLMKVINLLNKKRIPFRTVPSAYETVISNMVLYGRGPAPFVGSTIFRTPMSWYWPLKRIIDVMFSLTMLIITFPLMLLIAFLIKITSPGPILYLQKRSGLNGKSFIIYKFRTMRVNAEKSGKPVWARERDMRITSVGRLLRRFRLDEIPQFINVLRNEMSIIGPRPERPYFTSRLLKKIPFYAERLQVKPGISGWAQVNIAYAATEETSEQKLIYDLYYIQNISFALDFLIALKTMRVVLLGIGAR